MTYRTKYRVSMVLVAAVLLGAVQGFAMLRQEVLYQENVWPGSLLLFGSVIAGITVTIFFYYYRAPKRHQNAATDRRRNARRFRQATPGRENAASHQRQTHK